MDFYEYLYLKGKLEKEELEKLKSKEEKPAYQLIHNNKLSHRQFAQIFSQYLQEKEIY
jgi:hypothetical protein